MNTELVYPVKQTLLVFTPWESQNMLQINKFKITPVPFKKSFVRDNKIENLRQSKYMLRRWANLYEIDTVLILAYC